MTLARSARLRPVLFVFLLLGPVLGAPAQLSVSLLPDGFSAGGGALLMKFLIHSTNTGGRIGKSVPAIRFDVPILAVAL